MPYSHDSVPSRQEYSYIGTLRTPYSSLSLDTKAIMSADALNANPTILNVSDLPTRRRQQEQRHQGTSPTKSFASFVTSVRCTPDVLAADGSSDSSLLDGTDDESDASPEDIDEQEVFGMLT